ncbi:MAG TPA: LytTR family DNA-binding domain-containing protein [Holophagaceae bacterium]|nr:LytTR family DNA-binding domain-containing protein [Holophagaceae bacterium]
MSAIRIAVVDDEPLARERLSRLLTELGVEVAVELEDGTDLLQWLRSDGKVDALFLDINMPGATGLEIMAELPPSLPVVFVTAHADYAVRAFDSEAVDYVVKPVFKDRLERALTRIRSRGSAVKEGPGIRSASQGVQPRFPVRAGDGHVFLDLRKVTHFEIDVDTVWAWCGGNKFKTPWGALAEVESAFQEACLVRAQRHILLRPEMVTGVRPLPGGRCSARMGDGVDIPVSRSATPRLKELLHLR